VPELLFRSIGSIDLWLLCWMPGPSSGLGKATQAAIWAARGQD
jgi:hypothetical protein